MRILKVLGISVLTIAVLLAVAVYSFLQGWHVTELSPEELSSLLQPHYALVRPDGEGPFPAVLLFHGCGGVRRDLSTQADTFRALGFVAVVVDSNEPRGLDSDSGCNPLTSLWGRERAGDVLVSLDFVRTLKFVDPERIVLAGWSTGSWAVMELLAMDPPQQLPTNLSSAPAPALSGVAGALFLSPFCGFPGTVAPPLARYLTESWAISTGRRNTAVTPLRRVSNSRALQAAC
jgi:pimeloyl-ACP methyl ester carboxylesterase